MNHHRYLTISCAVLARECYHCAAQSRNQVDVRIVDQGLHDIGEERMSSALQREIDTVDHERYDAILLAYGLCNNGVRNLKAPVPLVLPRAHDCITLLMGSAAAYLDYFHANPGTFFQSVGWTERAKNNLSNPQSTTREMGMASYEEYVEKFGKENADYLMETLNDHFKNYSRLAYIDTGLPNTEQHEQQARQMAGEQDWQFDKIEGSMRLISQMMDGQWDSHEFLVVRPGQTVDASYDDDVIRAVDA